MEDRQELNRNLAQMLKGGVIMDVTTPEQARIAEEAGACAVMALERIPADIRAAGGVSRMSDPAMIRGIQEAVSIPVMAKCRIGHIADAGLPVFATCAGLILLAERIENDDAVWFASLPVTVKRNAYGRQLGSFTTRGAYDGSPDITMTFIRAPAITAVGEGVKILSSFDGQPTAVRWRNITALAWHPELTLQSVAI